MKKVVIFTLSAALAVFAFSSVQAADAVKNEVTVTGFLFDGSGVQPISSLEPIFCKVSGKGLQKEGKKVTLKVKTTKDYSFAGWCDEFGNPLEMATDYRSPSLSFVMPCAPTNFCVRLIKKTDDTKCDISLEGAEFNGDTTIDESNTNLTIAAGAPYEMSVSVDSYTPATLKVKGLPKGLKFNSKTRKISGVPTKAGTFTVTVKATNVSKNQKELKFAITVLPVEDWAVGTFDGAYTNGADVGVFTLTVKKTGAISGKLSAGKYTHTFKAKNFDTATVVAKKHTTNSFTSDPVIYGQTVISQTFTSMRLTDKDFEPCDPYVDAYTATIKVLINSKQVTIPVTFVELNKAINWKNPNDPVDGLMKYTDIPYGWSYNPISYNPFPWADVLALANAGDVEPNVPAGSYLWNDGASVGCCYSADGAWNSSQRKYDATTGYKVNDLRGDGMLLADSIASRLEKEYGCTFISLSAKGALKFTSAEGKKVTVYPSVYEVVNDEIRGNYTDFIFSYLKKDKTLDTMTFRVGVEAK